MIGSTRLASREAPERVVELLNEFFAAVVEVTADHGGFVNKFEGDGALCVFGAPVELDDFAGGALGAARDLRVRRARASAARRSTPRSACPAVPRWPATSAPSSATSTR